MTYKIDDTVRVVRPVDGFKWRSGSNAYDGKIGSVVIVDGSDNSVMVKFGSVDYGWFSTSEVEHVSVPVPDTTVQSAIDFLISQGYDVTISKKANFNV